MGFWRGELFLDPANAEARPLVATSACLLGEPVRYDGGHRYQATIERHLAPWLRLQAICPEVGIGLGVPRPTLEAIDDGAGARIVMSEDHSVDVTARLRAYAQHHVDAVGDFWPLCGYILKARSPSCGLGSLPVRRRCGPGATADGAFAGHLRRRLPWLPMVEEEGLRSAAACADFLLLAALCQDILWQPAGMAELLAHYAGILGPLPAAGTPEPLWLAVRARLRRDAGARCELVARFRAADPPAAGPGSAPD